MSPSAGLVKPQDVAIAWPHIRAWVDAARGEDRSYSLDDIREACEKGWLDLWCVDGGCGYVGFMMATVLENPRAKIYYGSWCGGVDLNSWVPVLLQQVKARAASLGCAAISFMGRPAWEKMLGIPRGQAYYYINLE